MGAPVDYIMILSTLILLMLFKSQLGRVIKLPQTIFFMLFFVCVFLSNAIGGDIGTAVKNGYEYLRFFLIYLIVAGSLDSQQKIKWTGLVIAVLTAFIAYQGIVQINTGTNIAGMSLYRDESRVRWVGVFDGSNTTCLAFLFAFPFALNRIFFNPGIFSKILYIALLSLLSVGIYLTESRGGFMSLLILIFFFISFHIKNKKGVIIGAVMAALIFTVAAPGRFAVDDPEKSSRGRISAWSEALDIVRYNDPLLGVGKGRFTEYSRIVAHNSFLQQLGETGLIGAFFWIGIFYCSFKGLLGIAPKISADKASKVLYEENLLVLIGLVAATMFLSAEHELLYIAAALCAAVVAIYGDGFKIVRKDLIKIGAIEVFGVLFFYLVVNVFRKVI